MERSFYVALVQCSNGWTLKVNNEEYGRGVVTVHVSAIEALEAIKAFVTGIENQICLPASEYNETK